MEIFYEDAGSLYKRLLYVLIEHGKEVEVKGRLTKEILGVHLILNDPLKNIILSEHRKMNLRFAVREWLWIMGGRDDVDYLAVFNQKIRDYSDDGVTLAGAYGPKITEQLPYVLGTLQSDPMSRQAVLTIWERNPKPSKDIPCTVSMQFIIRDYALHMIVNMRSSDAWLGIPYDIFSFTMIQNYLAYVLKVELGHFHMFLGSSHLYIDNIEAARNVAELFASHGRSHDFSHSHVIDPLYPFSYWEKMLVSPEETRKKISSYDTDDSFDFPGIDDLPGLD